MEFKYEKRFENNEEWYTVGVIKGLLKDDEIYAVEVLDPAGKIMCDPEKWSPGNVAVAVFGITDDEYDLFSKDVLAFTRLVERLKADLPKDRMFAEKNCVRTTDRKDTIDEDGKFKKYVEEKVKKHSPNLKESPGMIISRLLNAQKICVAYSTDTDRPVLNVVNDNANLILTEDEAVMDAFLKNQPNLYKKVFLENAINKQNEHSLFVYFYKIGINMLGYLFPDNRVLNFPMEAVIKSEEFKANKPAGVANPELERYVTTLYQLLRTAKLDDEKAKEAFNKNMSYLDVKVMEKALGGQFLLAQKAIKHDDGKIEFTLPVIEQKETNEKFIPVFTCDEEFVANGEGFERVVISYDQLKEAVKNSGLSGFIVNCKSKCSFRFNKQKLEQVEKFREWKTEQEAKTPEEKSEE